jgi:hypothetical protein
MSDAADPSHPPTETSEGELATQLGVSRADLKKMRRELEPEKDWRGGAGTPVMLQPSGVAKLRALLEKKGAGEAASAPSGPAYVSLKVVRVASPRDLLCVKEGLAMGPVRVRVKHSANFMPGMVLTRCHPRGPSYPGAYTYQGPLPRRKGRWK